MSAPHISHAPEIAC